MIKIPHTHTQRDSDSKQQTFEQKIRTVTFCLSSSSPSYDPYTVVVTVNILKISNLQKKKFFFCLNKLLLFGKIIF